MTKFCTSLLLAVTLTATAADAGPLSNLRARFSGRRNNSPAAQQSVETTRSRERSRRSSSTTTQSAPAKAKAPTAPAEAAPAPKTAPKKTAAKTASLSADETRMVEAINRYRADRHLAPLTPDPTLERVARLRVGVFNHRHPRFGWSWEQAHAAGFSGPVTDNLAQGYPTPEEAVGNGASGWGDERAGHTVGHDRQMKGFTKINGQWVDQRFNLCGVAHEGQNFIAVFGRRDNSSCGCTEGGDCTCGPNCNCQR